MLRLSRKHLETLRSEAERAEPVEVCAFLIGRAEGDTVTVTDVRVAENIEGSPLRFAMDPETLYNILNQAEEEGKAFVGVFHSHPTPASASTIDLRYMQLDPIAWLIMSTTDGYVKAYQWWKGSLQTVEVEGL